MDAPAQLLVRCNLRGYPLDQLLGFGVAWGYVLSENYIRARDLSGLRFVVDAYHTCVGYVGVAYQETF